MIFSQRYYYLSKDGRIMQTRRFHPAVAAVAAVAVLCVASFVGFQNLSGTDSKVREISLLKKQVESLQTRVDRISRSDDELRVAARLPLTPEEEKKMSTGGNRGFISNNSPEGLLASTEQMIEHLTLQIDRQKESHVEIRQSYESNRTLFSSLPAIKPINGYITSGFGMRIHPVYKRMLFHTGTDFSAPVGSRVFATGDGVVTFSGFDKGYGKKVIIDHGYGYQTIYAHLSKAMIRQGQHIKRGEVIAFSGNSGVSTGPHLHYEVRKDNIQVNPTAYFFDDMAPEKFMTLQKQSQEKDDNNS
jgi:murein DD-endopeptidase MepM/ murein hydrolase activator NlpD